MIVFPTPKDSIVTLFKRMVQMFDGEAYRDLNALYQFVFTDIENGFPVHIRFSRGSAACGEGWAEQPSVVIRTTSGVWLDIAGGLRNAAWALVTKRVRVEGDLRLLRLLPKILTRTIETPAPKTTAASQERQNNVLVFIGNPRKKNGLTVFYLSPFVEGMRRAGAKVEEIHLYDKKINHCLGCFACWTRTPGVCVHKDDQAGLLEKMEHSDLIVYAVPLYFHGLPGLVKDHFDRQLPRAYPYMKKVNGLMSHPLRKARKKNYVLFSICGFPELEQFEPLVKTFEAYISHEDANLRAKVLIPSAMQLYNNPTRRSDLVKKFGLLQKAGELAVRQDGVPKRILKEIANSGYTRDWIRGANLHWHNQIESKGESTL